MVHGKLVFMRSLRLITRQYPAGVLKHTTVNFDVFNDEILKVLTLNRKSC